MKATPGSGDAGKMPRPPPVTRWQSRSSVEKQGFFFWGRHQEQFGDWEDELVADIENRNDANGSARRFWAAWNSTVAGPIAYKEPISDRPHTLQAGTIELALPPTACSILGKKARLKFTVSQHT